MSNGQWCLKFEINATGENSFGGEVNFFEEITVPLFAETLEDARKQAELAAKQSTKYKVLRKLCSSIDDEDEIVFYNFRLIYEESLEINISKIPGGP